MTHHQPLPPPPSHNHHHHHHHHNNHRHQQLHNEQPPHSSHHHLTPPPSYHHHRRNHHHYHSSSASMRGCCCCLLLLLSFLFLLTLTVVLVIILAVKPKKPQFHLQQVALQYITLSTTTATATATATTTAPTTASLSLAVRMLFTAKNDNKVGIKYGVSTFNIMYRGIPLGRGSVPGFYQPAHSVRRVQTTVSVDRVNLMQADAGELVRDATVYDRVELRILGDVSAKIRILGLTSPSVQASVDCGIAISPTKQALIYKQCGFDGLQV